MGKALLYELGSSTSFAQLCLRGKVLWPMLLAASDDQGRGLAEDKTVKWKVCPNVVEITVEDVPGLLAEMEDEGMICLYRDGRGRLLYQIIRWWEYQCMQWAQPSKYAPPEGWTDRVRVNLRGTGYATENWDTTGGFSAQPPQPPEEAPPDDEGPDGLPGANPGGNVGGNAPAFPNKSKLSEGKLSEDSPESAGAPPPPANPEPETPKESSPAPPESPKQKRASKGVPVAVKVFRANACRYPAKAWYDDVDEAVGDNQADLDFWGNVVKAWVGLGWNPTNVRGMLEFYGRREIPTVRGGNGRSGTNRSNNQTPTKPPAAPVDPAQVERDRAALRDHRAKQRAAAGAS